MWKLWWQPNSREWNNMFSEQNPLVVQEKLQSELSLWPYYGVLADSELDNGEEDSWALFQKIAL